MPESNRKLKADLPYTITPPSPFAKDQQLHLEPRNLNYVPHVYLLSI